MLRHQEVFPSFEFGHDELQQIFLCQLLGVDLILVSNNNSWQSNIEQSLEVWVSYLPNFKKNTFTIWHVWIWLNVIHLDFLLMLNELFHRVPCILHVSFSQLLDLLLLLVCDLRLCDILRAWLNLVIFILVVGAAPILPQIWEFLHGFAWLANLGSIFLDQLCYLAFFLK